MKQSIINIFILAFCIISPIFAAGPLMKDPAWIGSLGTIPTSNSGARTIPDLLWWTNGDGSGTTITALVGPNGYNSGTWSGGAIVLNGTSQYATNTTPLTFGTNQATVSFWINTSTWNGGGANRTLFNNQVNANGSFQIFEQFGDLNFELKQDGGSRSQYISSGNLGLSTGIYVNIVAYFDNSTSSGNIRVWTNGIEAITITNASKTGTGNILNGYFSWGSSTTTAGWTGGSYDDLRIFSGLLMGTDASSIYNDGKK